MASPKANSDRPHRPIANQPVRPRSQNSQSPGWLFSALRESSSPPATESPASTAATSLSPPPVFRFGSTESHQEPKEEVFTFRVLHNVTPRPSVEPEATTVTSPQSLPVELDTAELKAPGIQNRRTVSTPPNLPVEVPNSPSSSNLDRSLFHARITSLSDFDPFLPSESSLLTPPGAIPRRRAISDVSEYSALDSDDSVSETPYDVRDEETPVEPFFTTVFQNALQRGLDVAKDAVSAMNEFDGSLEPESHLQRLLKDAQSLTTFHSSDTRTIAILGDSGEGKSSLINSMLHCPGIAMTSDLGSACTSVVTEYRQKKEGQTAPIFIEVEYLSQEHLEEQIRELVWNYRQFFHPDIEKDSVSAEEYRRVQRESDKAWSALNAAFGHQTGFTDRMVSDQSDGALESVTKKLIEWSKDIEWPQGEEGEDDGMWTSTAETAEECCEKTNEFMQDRLWPFTKIIRVYLNSVVLKTGIVIADLPGLQDTNLARVQATQDYLMKSDYVFIVAKISRAKTDKSLKDSIHTVLSRHVSLEDDSAPMNFHLAVVCTMTEEIDEKGARQKFCGPGKIIDQTQMDQLDKDVERAKRSGDRRLKKTLKQRRTQLLIDARNKHVTEGLQRDYAPKMNGGRLEVFCVSNKTYQKFSEKGDAAMVRASGIPELRRFCHSAVAGARLLEAKNFLQSKIGSLLNSIEIWTKSVPVAISEPTVQDNRPSLDYQIVEDEKTKIINEVQKSKRKIQDSFRESIMGYLDKRGEEWEKAAEKKGLEWQSWHWSQYNAWCNNNGNHFTSKRGAVNWNGELNWKMRTELAFEWDTLEEEIPNIFEELLRFIKRSLKEVLSYLEGFNPPVVAGIGLRTQDVEYKYGLLQRELQRRIRFIRSRSSEPNETSYMVREMIPAYRSASQEFGTGKAQRQRSIVQGKITDGTLFFYIAQNIMSDVGSELGVIFEKILVIIEEMFGCIKNDIDMIMPGGIAAAGGSGEREPHSDGDGDNLTEEKFKEQLAAELQKLRSSHENVLHSIASS